MSKIFGFSKKVIFYYFIIFSFHNISIAEEETLLILGDSISAGYGINQKDNWVSMLQSKFNNDGTSIKLINSSVSGDTTSGGLQRLKRDLQKFDPDYVLIELGGNDALRGYPIKRIKDNLQTMIALIKNNKQLSYKSNKTNKRVFSRTYYYRRCNTSANGMDC